MLKERYLFRYLRQITLKGDAINLTICNQISATGQLKKFEEAAINYFTIASTINFNQKLSWRDVTLKLLNSRGALDDMNQSSVSESGGSTVCI